MGLQISGWGIPDQSWIGIRNTEETFAQTFVEKGQIKFNSPQSWVDYASKNVGRGDPYEGMVACCPECDEKKLAEFRKKYPKLRQDRYNGNIIFRWNSDMVLPCFCYYSLSNKLFKCPTTPGVHSLSYHIPADYFRTFDDSRPAIVTFQIAEFHQMLMKYLVLHGVEEREILIHKIKYIHYANGMWIDKKCSFPYELFSKTDQFCVQQEDRIVIFSKRPEVLKLFEKPIEIGNLNSIARYCSDAQQEKKYGLDVYMMTKIEARP